MRTLFFFVCLLLTVGLKAQKASKAPKAPKADAFGKETLWDKYEHPDIFPILSRTKSLAILPVSASLYARKMNEETLQKTQNEINLISSELQKMYFSLLYGKVLSLVLQRPEETNRILREKNLIDNNSLQKVSKNNLCFLLGVDAVMFVDVTQENLKSPAAEAALSIISLNTPVDELAIGLRMYEKANGEFIWSNFYYDKRKSSERPIDIFRKIVNYSIADIPFVIK